MKTKFTFIIRVGEKSISGIGGGVNDWRKSYFEGAKVGQLWKFVPGKNGYLENVELIRLGDTSKALLILLGLGLAVALFIGLFGLGQTNKGLLSRDVVAITPEWVQVGRINNRLIECDRIQCDENWVQVYDENAYFLPINPGIEFDGYYPGAGIIIETPGAPMSYSLATVTAYPICTAVACENGNLVGGDPGGCGAYCEPWTPVPTPTCPGISDTFGNCMKEYIYTFTVPSPTPEINTEIVEWNVDIKPYYHGLGTDGKPKDLNERNSHTLYNYSDGYRLPHCEYIPPELLDMSECTMNPTHLLYVVHVIGGLPADRDSYWGAINGSTFICLYANGVWYTDWRPGD